MSVLAWGCRIARIVAKPPFSSTEEFSAAFSNKVLVNFSSPMRLKCHDLRRTAFRTSPLGKSGHVTYWGSGRMAPVKCRLPGPVGMRAIVGHVVPPAA